jgi:hypothetical protein
MALNCCEFELATRKSVNSNGLRPGIEVVAPAILDPGEVMDVFNPFYFSYGQPIYAPAAGRVCVSRNDIPDN